MVGVGRLDRQNFLLMLPSHMSVITCSDQLLLLFLTYLYPEMSPLTPCARLLSVTVKKTLNMPALINHSTMFLLASNAFSFCLPAFLSSFFLLLVHSYCGRTLLLSLFF